MSYEKGCHPIDGERLFVNVVEYETTRPENRFWEAHRNYPVSYTHLKCVMGINFMDYLVSIRIEAAKKLLKGTDLRIYEVARSVGIEDPNYFSKFFKKHTQETPAQYRDRCQEAL